MRGIHIAAVITTATALALYGALLKRLSDASDRRRLLLAFCLTLPLQPLAFYLVRVPLDAWLVHLLGKDSGLYLFLTTFYAPLTEEPAKLLPLMIPLIYRSIRRENFVHFALALGVGFGIGEMWFLAERVARMPEFAPLPFYMFGGFFVERLMVCLMHGGFTAVALRKLRNGFLWGVLGAMALHYIGNFPLYLAALDFGKLGKTTWQVILTIWVPLYFLSMLALLARLNYGRFEVGRFAFGETRCPECGLMYPRPLLGLNFFKWRYERCPHCRKFHWVG
jgi:hypothetical protein